MTTSNFTFQVYQSFVYIKRQGVGSGQTKIGEFPATMHGLRKARACAADNTYGQEPGRIAPKAKCFIVAAKDGAPIKLTGHEPYEDRDTWLNYWLIGDDELSPEGCKDWRDGHISKTAAFNIMMAKIEKTAQVRATS